MSPPEGTPTHSEVESLPWGFAERLTDVHGGARVRIPPEPVDYPPDVDNSVPPTGEAATTNRSRTSR